MDPVILTAILSLVSACIVALISYAGTVKLNNANEIKKEKDGENRTGLLEQKLELFSQNISESIERLEKKQDKHNNLIERMYETEKTTAQQSRDIKTLYTNVSEIKSDIKDVRNDMEGLKKEVHALKEEDIKIETQLGKI